MKITIIHVETRNNRADYYDGETIRYGGVGVSGTEQTFILIAESFARAGHEVILCAPVHKNSTYRGVKYQDNWSGIFDSDILIIPPWVGELHEMAGKFTKLKKIYVQMHNNVFLHHHVFNAFWRTCADDDVKVCFVYPSEWAKENSRSSIEILDCYSCAEHVVIPNPLMDDLLDAMPPPPLDRKFSFVFGASWERGGEVAMRAFRRCISENIGPRDATFCIMDYCYTSSHKNHASSPSIVALASCDKKTVFENLYKSSYFVYPLVLPNGYVHADTFGCCVAEALACGAIVITWSIAALPELYRDHAICVEPCGGVADLNSEEAVTIIVNTIRELEADPERAREIRARGMEFARAQFSAKKVAHSWLSGVFGIQLTQKSPEPPSRTILSVFSGRRNNIEIQRPYLEKALRLGIIDEVHYWNYAHSDVDVEYLRTISNLKYTSANIDAPYREIYPVFYANGATFDIAIKCSREFHIRVGEHIDIEFSEECAKMRNIETGELYSELNGVQVLNECEFVKFRVCVDHSNIIVLAAANNDYIEILRAPASMAKQPPQIYVKSGGASGAETARLEYTPRQNAGFYLMDKSDQIYKHWHNYYNYYAEDAKTACENDIIMKCDDDVVFIDIERFPKYIEFIRNQKKYDLVFANVVNNGVAAFLQQDKLGLIPRDLMELEYPEGGECGSLWSCGKKAEKLHHYFVENYSDFLSDTKYPLDPIEISTIFSINFFGYKLRNWGRISDAGKCDELNLTQKYVKERGFKNVFYPGFVVAHLSFWRQLETGMNLDEMWRIYRDFAARMCTAAAPQLNV